MYTLHRLVAVCAALFALSLPAFAHRAGESYIYLNVTETTLEGRYEVPLDQIGLIFDVDTDGDGTVSEEEFSAAFPDIAAHFQDRIHFIVDGTDAPVEFVRHDFLYAQENPWALMYFDIQHPEGPMPPEIQVQHTGSWDEANPFHVVLVLIENNAMTGLKNNEAQYSLIFAGGPETLTLNLTGATSGEAFVDFFKFGAMHAAYGFDHIALFVLLSLTSVLIATGSGWAPVPAFGPAARYVAAMVLIFVLTSLVGQALVAFSIFRLPMSIVGKIFHAAVIAVALANLFVKTRAWVLPVLAILGALHGLGLGGEMEVLALEKTTLIPSIIGFNLGLALVQALILCVPFTIFFFVRNHSAYRTVCLKGGSAIILLIALYWYGERVFVLLAKMVSS